MKKFCLMLLVCCFWSLQANQSETNADENKTEKSAVKSSEEAANIVVQKIEAKNDDFTSFKAKVFHPENALILKENENAKVIKNEIPLTIVPPQDRIKITVDYLHNCCMITDVRTIKAKRGLNKVRFEKIVPCDISSVALRTPNKGKIRVRSYTYNPPINSSNEWLRKIEGESVGEQGNQRKIVLCISDDHSPMVITSNKSNKHFVRSQGVEFFSTPVSCAAIEAMYSLDVSFESDTTEEVELEICYTTSAITQQCAYDVDIFEKFDRVDIRAKSILSNDSGIDLKNAIVAINKKFLGNLIVGLQDDMTLDNVNLLKYGQTVCVFPYRNAQHSIMYRVKISQNDLENFSRNSVDKALSSLIVRNLITLENVGKDILNTFDDTFVNVYYRQGDCRKLCNKFKLSDVHDRDWILEIGETNDITAQYQKIDRAENTKNQLDYGFKIILKNNKTEDVDVNVFIDIDSEKYKVLRSNIEQRNGEWIVPLKAGESKELQIRMRVEKI